MSEDFANIMKAISGDTIEERIKVFSDVLDKITQFAVNSIDQLTKTVARLEATLQNMQGRITQLEQRPVAVAPAANAVPGPVAPAPIAPPPPKPEPKPLSPMSARAALQSELKQLFAKRKRD
ncbi:MAG: hypothetical protein ACTSQQ_12810 [Candidatus Helarchaeota archaeon]